MPVPTLNIINFDSPNAYTDRRNDEMRGNPVQSTANALDTLRLRYLFIA